MHRAQPIRSATTLALLSLVLTGSLVSSGSAAAPRAQLRGFVCQRALGPAARAVSITAVMRPLTGTRKLQIRFELLSKAAGAPAYVSLSGKGLGGWISPNNPPTLGRRAGDVYKVIHPVAELAAPASYRFRVSFRWLGVHGKVLGQTTKTSATCRQPELRPDLLVRSITAQPVAGHPKLNDYVVVIRNRGATAASHFSVEFTDGSSAKSATVKRLAARSRHTLKFVGPACSAIDPPSVTVDPQNQVDDADRGNNTFTAVCPGP